VALTRDVIEWGHERARAGRWHGDARVALLTPVPGAPAPSPSFVERCVQDLAARGYDEVVTGALAPPEQQGFLRAGFAVREHLVLLSLDVRDRALDRPPVPGMRRARRSDRDAVIALDHAAFRPFWRFDGAALQDALDATPAVRFRVVDGPAAVRPRGLAGYAVSGRAGTRGYLQRLAVDPRAQRRGMGRGLVLDALSWLVRRGVDQVVVNTQPDNEPALELYRSLGFRTQAGGLDVLARAIS
jgi:ribosomal protein S18 acetylase RimI-like enzyme